MTGCCRPGNNPSKFGFRLNIDKIFVRDARECTKLEVFEIHLCFVDGGKNVGDGELILAEWHIENVDPGGINVFVSREEVVVQWCKCGDEFEFEISGWRDLS